MILSSGPVRRHTRGGAIGPGPVTADPNGISAWRVRGPRSKIDLNGELLIFPDTSLHVRVLTLSAEGFGAEVEDVVAIGAQVVLTIPEAGDYVAQVRWFLAGRMGGRFNGRMSDAEKSLLRRIVDAAAAKPGAVDRRERGGPL